MHPIMETIVGTLNADGTTHLAPLGVHVPGGKELQLLPFRPSRTLDNLARAGVAVVNYTDDVRVFAGCLTGRRDWPLADAGALPVRRLRDALAHAEVRVTETRDDKVRPRFTCAVVGETTHRPFRGFSRAQAAVIELAIVASRLHLLPPEEVAETLARLRVAHQKTAGENEKTAWRWLCEKIEQHAKHAERGAPAA